MIASETGAIGDDMGPSARGCTGESAYSSRTLIHATPSTCSK